ncbi:MAG: peptidylprolyl isomerase [Lachnospira sp.]|nr:peptidylprolyl isomerase [Lachnospira sp.]
MVRIRHREKQILMLVAIALVVLLAFLYIRFFNGSLIYISTGFGKDKLFKVEKQSVYKMEAKILMSDSKSEYEKILGSDIWSKTVGDVTFEEYAKEQVKAKLIRVQCMNIMAKEKGVVLSRAQSDAVSNAVDAYYNSLTENQISELKVTKEKLKQMFTEFAIAKTLYDDMTSNLEFEISADEARVITIQYICADSLDKINAAKTRIDNGETFYLVAKEHTGDEYECELKRGQMVEDFEKAAFNLKTGETSGVVEIEGKYYIIKCTSDNENNKTEANKQVILEQKKLDNFNATFEAYEADKYVSVNKKVWDGLSVSATTQLDVNFEEIYNQYVK